MLFVLVQPYGAELPVVQSCPSDTSPHALVGLQRPLYLPRYMALEFGERH
jgi:hypothetical protein